MSAQRKLLVLAALMSATIFTGTAEARDFRTRPPEFLGGIEKQRLILELAQRSGFETIETDAELLAEINRGHLVKVHSNGVYYVDQDLGVHPRRGEYEARHLLYYLHPAVERELAEIAVLYHRQFGKKLKLTSFVRSGDYQRWLAQGNANARISLPSGHQTTLVADFSKKEMPPTELRWMREELYRRAQDGKIVVIEEMVQLAFHIFVVPPTPETLPASHPLPADWDCTTRL